MQLAAVLGGFDVVDLAPVVRPHMPGWPSHPPVEVVADARTFDRDGYYLQVLVLPEHSGCHVDAPAHSHRHLADQTMDVFPADCLLGVAKKIDAGGEGLRPGDELSLRLFRELAEAAGIEISAGDIVLVDMGWQRYAEPGCTGPGGEPAGPEWWGGNQPGFAEDLCRYLSQQQVKAVGTDTAACDIAAVDGRARTGYGHVTYFLPRGILIIEGLCGLAALPPVSYFLATPLKVLHGSGSPLRPVALVPRADGSALGYPR
jgi:arylformamidase